MPHGESQSVSRMMENITSGLTGRDWKPAYGLVNKSLRNRKGGATGYQTYEVRRQSFTLLAVLTQILVESIKQYYQLKQIIEQGSDQADFLRQINSGIENSIGILQSLPVKDEKILGDLREFQSALRSVADVYGMIPKSQEALMQTLHDQTIAESLRMVNTFKDYSDTQERNSILIAAQSREASPRGAARMQAETSAQILQSLAQLIRLNTQMLKLQSEQFGMSNKAGKDSVGNFQKVNTDLGKSFQGFKSDMGLPKF